MLRAPWCCKPKLALSAHANICIAIKAAYLVLCSSQAGMEPRHAAAAFAAGAAVGLGATLLYTRATRSQNTAADQAAAAGEQGLAAAAPPLPVANGGSLPAFSMADFDSDEILEEQLTRNVQFFGLEAQRRIGGAFVVVVGLGVSSKRRAEASEAQDADGIPKPCCCSSGCLAFLLTFVGLSITAWWGSLSCGKIGCGKSVSGKGQAAELPLLPRRAWGRTRRTCCCGRGWAACGS